MTLFIGVAPEKFMADPVTGIAKERFGVIFQDMDPRQKSGSIPGFTVFPE
jgi:hypothetical protein